MKPNDIKIKSIPKSVKAIKLCIYDDIVVLCHCLNDVYKIEYVIPGNIEKLLFLSGLNYNIKLIDESVHHCMFIEIKNKEDLDKFISIMNISDENFLYSSEEWEFEQ